MQIRDLSKTCVTRKSWTWQSCEPSMATVQLCFFWFNLWPRQRSTKKEKKRCNQRWYAIMMIMANTSKRKKIMKIRTNDRTCLVTPYDMESRLFTHDKNVMFDLSVEMKSLIRRKRSWIQWQTRERRFHFEFRMIMIPMETRKKTIQLIHSKFYHFSPGA